MSGIYGSFNRKQADSSQLTKALTQMAPWLMAYGDDVDSVHGEKCSGSVGLGIYYEHLTVSPRCETPVLCRDDITAVLDVILYNRAELIERYGNRICTKFSMDDASLLGKCADEELLLDLILACGYEVLRDVNGDFAGAVYDESANALTLFRDHMGVRPIFYYAGEETVGFSTDIRGLLANPGVPGRVNPDWLYRMSCGYDTADMTATELQDVYEVRPGSFITFTTEHNSEKRYWQIGTRKLRLSSRRKYTQKLREMITDSVWRRLAVFQGVVGGELSGGLDSGVIDILIHRLGREGVFYSWSFSPEDLPLVPDDERSVIQDICDQEGIFCHYGAMTMDFSPNATIAKKHARVGLPFDYQVSTEMNFALPPYINTLIICETAQLMREKGARVVFSGHGGDEGVSHRCDPFELYYHGEYLRFFECLWKRNRGEKNRLIKTLKDYRYRMIHKTYITTKTFRTGTGAPEILREDFRERYRDTKMPVLTFAFDSIAYVESGNTHNRPDVAGLLGAYSGARYVFPYLDYRVIDYAVSIPRYLYLNGSQNRFIFREAFKDMMPESLYRCTAKNNPSTMHLHEGEEDNQTTEDWYEAMRPYRNLLKELLDREYWKEYLDMDAFDRIVDGPNPADEEREAIYHAMERIRDCIQLQKMIQMAKKTT